MDKQTLQQFEANQIHKPDNILGGAVYRVYCKDEDGTLLGTYETECRDTSYWLTDCTGLYPRTAMATGGPI